MSERDTPLGPGPADGVAALATRDGFLRLTGVELVACGSGTATTRVVLEARHMNFNGACHGGVVFTVADSAFGCACNSYGRVEAGIDCHIVYASAARLGDTLTAVAVEVARSRKLSTYRVDVTKQDGTLVATFTGTAYITDRRHG